ncbi:MAG: hypothetical protein L7W40_14500 [Akkermansiaceae bacterium]|nr:hypothetical protein [Akkermansiaceae bacterium]
MIKGYSPQLGEKAPLLQNYYYRLRFPHSLLAELCIPSHVSPNLRNLSPFATASKKQVGVGMNF